MVRKTYRDGQGYLRFINSGRLVHRWAAERRMGRKLKPGEVVHHQNKIKTDNRSGNLEVFSSRAQHRAYHIKAAWTRTRRSKSRKKR
ncbi:MAG: HNH endonuclease [Candidatus Thorarchaeota archaeon]